MIRRAVVLIALAGLLGLVAFNFYDQVVTYSPMTETQGGGPERPEDSRDAPRSGAAWGDSIVQRDLFSPERGYTPPAPPAPKVEIRPMETPKPEPVAPAAPVPVKIKPNFQLSGIILNQYGEHVAYIKTDKDPSMPLRAGDSYAGGVVQYVTEREVRLKWEGEEITLTLVNIKKL